MLDSSEIQEMRGRGGRYTLDVTYMGERHNEEEETVEEAKAVGLMKPRDFGGLEGLEGECMGRGRRESTVWDKGYDGEDGRGVYTRTRGRPRSVWCCLYANSYGGEEIQGSKSDDFLPVLIITTFLLDEGEVEGVAMEERSESSTVAIDIAGGARP